jgi:hypothetical protein
MAEHERAAQNKQTDVDQKHRVRQKESEASFDRFHAWDTGPFSLTETPFSPQMDEHAELLAMSHSDEQRANLVMNLQQTYGNSYVKRLINSMAIQAKLTVNAPNDIYEQELLQRQVATASKPATKEEAISKVDKHVVPRECFIRYEGTRRGWQPIPGTGCAHWVAHEKNITIGYKCDRGFSLRTGKLGKPGVITRKYKYSLQKAKVGDIWASTKVRSHVGIVRDVRKDKESGKVIEVQVEHDSSKQGGVVKDWFKEGEFYR